MDIRVIVPSRIKFGIFISVESDNVRGATTSSSSSLGLKLFLEGWGWWDSLPARKSYRNIIVWRGIVSSLLLLASHPSKVRVLLHPCLFIHIIMTSLAVEVRLDALHPALVIRGTLFILEPVVPSWTPKVRIVVISWPWSLIWTHTVVLHTRVVISSSAVEGGLVIFLDLTLELVKLFADLMRHINLFIIFQIKIKWF